jgi:hypothetical protein
MPQAAASDVAGEQMHEPDPRRANSLCRASVMITDDVREMADSRKRPTPGAQQCGKRAANRTGQPPGPGALPEGSPGHAARRWPVGIVAGHNSNDRGEAVVGSCQRREADMTFPNPPVATMRVCRITQRDAVSTGATGKVIKKLRSWWSLCHQW